jgi:DNA polymerase-3 subunit delta
MSVAAQRALRSAILDRTFEPVYYLHGDDDYRKEEAVAQLVAAVVGPSTRDFNLETYRGSEVDSARLSNALTALPMLAERRMVVLKDIGALKKNVRVVLDRYLAAPARETVLVLTSPAGAKPDAAAAEHATTVPFPPLGADDVTAWLIKHARKLGAELSPESAALLTDAIGSDLAHGVGELDKLMSFAAGRPIVVADVEAVVGVRRGESVADLLDAVAARNGARAAALVEPVLAQPKTTAVSVVISLTVQTLAMAWGKSSRDAGLSAGRLEAEFFKLLKAGGGFPGRPWGEAVKCWARNLPKWSEGELHAALDLLLAADFALKESRVSSEDAVLASLVLSLCTRAAATVAA